jgi:FkbH-like protein
VTDDDRRRGDSYRVQAVRRRAQSSARSFEDFLSSLDQSVVLEPVHEGTLARAAQLCQKTNQFNLTARRHSVSDLEAMVHDDAVELHAVGVRDRYGDSGITGVTIVRFDGDEAEIDTLLLSCRVLGRRVEDAVLAFLAERAGAGGARLLVGHYTPTERNMQVADFYARRGFTEAGENTWRLDLNRELPEFPPELSVEVSAHA